MARAVWTPHAEGELDDILFHIAMRDRRRETGEQVYYQIRQVTDEYSPSNAPRHVHPVTPPGWYYLRYKRWLVFYQLHPEGIEVLRVIDGSRDLPSLLP